MFFLEILTIGLVLSADSFSAAVSMGLRPFTRKDAIKFALSSGIAEALVAFIGSISGHYIVTKFASIDHWIAFGLLGAISLHMFYEGYEHLKHPAEAETLEFHGFHKILLVSFATSLDAFGVGISLGIAKKPIIPFLFSIGFWAFLTTLIGLYIAKKLSAKFGPIVNFLGASILAIMAYQMLSI